MRGKEIAVLVVVGVLLLLGCTAAFGLVIDDPTAGTVTAKMAPSANAPSPDAHGHAVINYVKGQGVFVVQANVVKLAPNTPYTVYLHCFQCGGGILELGPFTTDKKGNGRFHARVSGPIAAFDRVNIRLPFTPNSGVLSSAAPGGSLKQSPSNR